MNCIECLCDTGDIQPADFIVNGQSVCQRHVPTVIAEPNTKGKVYAWSPEFSDPIAVNV
jgi:hypothetical protein